MSEFLNTGLYGTGETDMNKLIDNWTSAGLLFSIPDKDREKAILYLEETAERILANEEYKNNDRMNSVVFPAIVRIFRTLSGNDDDTYWGIKFQDFEDLRKIGMQLFSIEEVLEEINLYSKECMIIGEKFIKHVDCEAELLVLFCRNYSYGIYKEAHAIMISTES